MAQELCIYLAAWEANLAQVPCHSLDFTSPCLVHALYQLFLSESPACMPRIPSINASIFYRSRMFISPIFFILVAKLLALLTSWLWIPLLIKVFLFSIGSSCSVLWVLAFFSCFQIHFFIASSLPHIRCCFVACCFCLPVLKLWFLSTDCSGKVLLFFR